MTAARSRLEQLVPPIAAAKGAGGPSVVFSPDARYAYLASSPDRWWGSLARIDLRDAKVVTSSTALGAVAAVALSPGGERLYALAADDRDERTLVLLEPQNLARFESANSRGAWLARQQSDLTESIAASRGTEVHLPSTASLTVDTKCAVSDNVKAIAGFIALSKQCFARAQHHRLEICGEFGQADAVEPAKQFDVT